MKSLTKNMMLQIGLAVSLGMLVLADPAPEGESSDFPVYEAEDGGTLEVAAGDTVGAGQFVGEGTFTKGGAGTLAVKDVVGYTGTVTVASGTLKLTGALPPYEPAMPASDNCVLHLDALDADTLTLVDHSDGVKRVSEWRSKTVNGWRAVPSSDSVGSYPRFAADDGLAGNAASVRMPTYVSMFFEDGEGGRVMATNILSVLWVLGSQEGGGHILGLGQTYDGRSNHFFRGPNSYGWNKDDYLFISSAHDGALAMEMYRNDMRLCADSRWPGGATADTPKNIGLSGGWDYLSGRVDEGAYRNRLAADSLAYDPSISYRCGNQRLAELLIFERVLTAAEERAASAYLRIKWGLEPTWQRSQTNALAAVVASGASLDLNGTNTYLRAVGGAGSVVNGDLTASGLIASAGGALSVSGTFTATDGFAVDLSALPAWLGGDLVIMTAAGGIVNAAAIRQAAVITGGYPEARVVVAGNSVVVRLQKPGFMLIYR